MVKVLFLQSSRRWDRLEQDLGMVRLHFQMEVILLNCKKHILQHVDLVVNDDMPELEYVTLDDSSIDL